MALALLLSAAAWRAERTLQRRGRTTRWLWLAAIAASPRRSRIQVDSWAAFRSARLVSAISAACSAVSRCRCTASHPAPAMIAIRRTTVTGSHAAEAFPLAESVKPVLLTRADAPAGTLARIQRQYL